MKPAVASPWCVADGSEGLVRLLFGKARMYEAVMHGTSVNLLAESLHVQRLKDDGLWNVARCRRVPTLLIRSELTEPLKLLDYDKTLSCRSRLQL